MRISDWSSDVCSSDLKADIVRQQGDDEVEPILRSDGLGQTPAAEEVLADERDQRRVIGVMIKGVAVGDALDNKPRRAVENGRVLRLALGKGDRKRVV